MIGVRGVIRKNKSKKQDVQRLIERVSYYYLNRDLHIGWCRTISVLYNNLIKFKKNWIDNPKMIVSEKKSIVKRC